jgi:AraC-like DNA-binding protein
MVFNSSWANQLVLLAQEFLEESTRRGHLEHHQLMEGYARLMALFLQRVLSHFQSTGADEHRRQLQTIWGNVSQNPGRHWNVANLAVTAHLSRSHFQARVQAICGCGVMEMVTRLRMERATGLLLQQHLKLAEIAGRVGYDSPFSFSRAFKRVFGVAPDDYRRRRLSRA